ncbi:MAG: dTMP kinase [Prevotellaceae bacterium]|jgi:dTMP kinase|nr:dTMP kinase [Prevotellaceae bacterium]
MFVVLEGLDGAGKSTQATLLRDCWGRQDIQTKWLHFPRFDTPVFGELIAKFLRGDFGDLHTVDPFLVALLFAGDRHDAAATVRTWLDNGYNVLLDRYVYSNIAYQCAKLSDATRRQALRQFILDMEYRYFAIPKPDLTVFLDVPLAHVADKLGEERSGSDRAYLQGKKDIHENSMELQRNVRRIYLEQAALDPTFKVVDCADGDRILDPARIFDKLKALM